MNEEQYRQLCSVCDEILLAPDSTLERVAIPYLHVIREHPVFLEKYEGIFRPSAISGNEIRSLHTLRAKFLGGVLWVKELLSKLFSDRTMWYGSKFSPTKIDVLFISHLVNQSHAGENEDFYFGKIPDEIRDSGKSSIVVLLNHTGVPGSAVIERWSKNSVPRLILSHRLGFLEEFRFYLSQRKEAKRLFRLAGKETRRLKRYLLERAAGEAKTSGTKDNLRYYKQISALAKRFKPESILLTYEGHAWERISFSAARSVNPDIKCIGYQHAAIFRMQYAIRRNLGSGYDPDQIMTAGKVSKKQLEDMPDMRSMPISVLGTKRVTGKIISTGKCWPDGVSRNSVCLVIPEGIESECRLLFEFSISCAKAAPQVRFIWRLHPILSFEVLRTQYKLFQNLPDNIVLSENTFSEDIAGSIWVLYRGTTAVIQAVLSGLRPIYLRLRDEMTIDPLYALSIWRYSVLNVTQMVTLLGKVPDDDSSNGKSELIRAQRYCEKYFVPFNTKVLLESLKSN